MLELIEPPKAFSISNLGEFSEANAMLSQWKDRLKQVDTDEKNITAPINKSLKEIRAKYKPIKEQCEQAILIIKNALNEYKRIEEAKREADRMAIEDLAKNGASMSELVELVDEAPSLGGRLTTIVTANISELSPTYKDDLLVACWDNVMIQIRKDVSAGRIENGVTVKKEKVI